MKKTHENITDDLRDEYEIDYSKAVRGKYAKDYSEDGTNIVVPEPDVAKSFRDSAAVNEALRSLLDVTRTTRRLTSGGSSRTHTRTGK